MSISSWLLSIAGISVVSILIDMILPNGQTSKYIKGIFAFFMLFVIISPIANLLKQNISVDEIFATSQIEIDNEFIYQVNRTKLSYLENQINDDFTKSNLLGANCVVNGDIFEVNMQIKNVFVDFSNLVILPENEHIDIRKTAKEIVLKHVEIEEEKIIFNE